MIDLKTKTEQVQRLCQAVLDIISDLKGEPGGVGPSPELPSFAISNGRLTAVYKDGRTTDLGKVVPDTPVAPTIDYEAVTKDLMSRINIPEAEAIDIEAIAIKAAALVQIPSVKVTNAEQIEIAKMAVAYIISNKLIPAPTSTVKETTDSLIQGDLIQGCIATEQILYEKINELEAKVDAIEMPQVLTMEEVSAQVATMIPQPQEPKVIVGPQGPAGKDSLPDHITISSYTKDIRNTVKDAIADLQVGNGLQVFGLLAIGSCTNGIDRFKSRRELTTLKENGVVRILEDKKITSDFPPLSGPLGITLTPDTDKITVYGTGIPEQEVQWKLIVTRYG